VAQLVELVAADLATWETPAVHERVLGTTEASAIAERFSGVVRERLGREVVGARFFAVSVGCVAGLELDDGTHLVVKAQSADRPVARVAACQRVARALSEQGFPCPRPVLDACVDGGALWTAETLLDRGAPADPHRAEIRRSIARSLHRIVELASPLRGEVALGPAWFTAVPLERTFPRPHSPLFDLERPGADWIDDAAREARRTKAAGRPVLGHFDWRSEHLRFEGDTLVASWDWDSLHDELETVMLGAAAHAFTADFQRLEVSPVPTLEEALAFVADYEDARGTSFGPDERATIVASLTYSTAYSARCEHGIREGEPASGDGFRRLLRALCTTRIG
jgi:hypothetical protein